MSEPGWPYERIEDLPETSDPSWLCPEQCCTCSEHEQEPGAHEFSVMLCTPTGERMPGARCRVVINGILANEDELFADGEGWMTVLARHAPETAWIEWAPAGTPASPDLPYRRRYYVDLAEDDLDESTLRRLYNLGFSLLPTLRENVQDFQYEYDFPALTGEPADIQEQLRLYHDEGMVPEQRRRPLRDQAIGATDGGQRDFQLVGFGGKAAPGDPSGAVAQSPPAQPASKGGTKAGSAGGKGTLKLSTVASAKLPGVVETIDRKEAMFAFMPVTATHQTRDKKKYTGVFWVFVDALQHNRSGLRLPCCAAEAQKAADRIKVAPGSLRDWDGAKDGAEIACLFLTPKLCDIRWAELFARGDAIEPCPQDINDLIARTSRLMNAEMEAQIINPASAVGDPGKIWAISNRLGDTVDGGERSINYGWHYKPRQATIGLAAVTPGQRVVQSEGGRHNAYHIDYSQTLLLVAGWCRITFPGESSPRTMKTEDVYLSTELAPLIAHDVTPTQALKLTRQPFTEKQLAASMDQFWKAQEKSFRQKRLQEDILEKLAGPSKA